MANVDFEVAGYLRHLIDIGASTSLETGVARRTYAPATVLVDGSGAILTPGGVSTNGILSSYSNSDVALAGNASFVPSGGSFNGYDDLAAMGWPSAIEVSVSTNVNGRLNSNGPSVLVEYSIDGTTVQLTDGAQLTTDTPYGGFASNLRSAGGTNVPIGTQKTFAFPTQNYQYVRVSYFNGAGAQGSFSQRTLYRYNPTERGLNYRYSPVHGSWEPIPTNAVSTVISSASRTAVAASQGTTGKRVNLMHIGAILAVNVTAVPAGSPLGLDVILEVSYDSGNTFNRINASLAGAYLTATGLYNFIWHPAANNLSTGFSANTAKQAVGFPFPMIWQARVVPQDNNAGISYTYSMNAAFITQ